MKKLHMDKYEISCSYREARNKKYQIKILSQLNLCTQQDIIDVLIECGYDRSTLPKIKVKSKKKNNNENKKNKDDNHAQT